MRRHVSRDKRNGYREGTLDLSFVQFPAHIYMSRPNNESQRRYTHHLKLGKVNAGVSLRVC